MRSAILDEAEKTGLNPTFIASIGLQESGLCTRAPTSRYEISNPGIFQTHEGEGSCNPGNGPATYPCPADTIRLMIAEGARGTRRGDGLKQLYDRARGQGAARYWVTARMYNSGTALERMEDGVATHSYVADIANRVEGNGFAVSGFEQGAVSGAGPDQAESVAVGDGPQGPGLQSHDVEGSEQTGEPCDKCTPLFVGKPQPPPLRAAAQTQGADRSYLSAIKIPLDDPRLVIVADQGTARVSLGPGAREGCKAYYLIHPADTCDLVAARFSTTYARMQVDNTKLGNDCNNMWAGKHYCMIP